MDPIPTPDQAIRPKRRRRGKIARLPRHLREQVNLMICDGLSYPEIIIKLGDAGKHLNKDNLINWHDGGYKEWLKDQPWLDELHGRLDFAASVIQDPDTPKIREASLCIAVKQMYGLITEFDPASCIQKLADDPATYSRVLNALSKLAEIGLQYDRHHSEAATHARARKSKPTSTAGVSPDMIHQYEREFGLLRRPASPAPPLPEHSIADVPADENSEVKRGQESSSEVKRG